MARIKYYDTKTGQWKYADKSYGSGSSGSAENGEDGFSPIAKVEQTATGAVISITDKTGTTTATITNGKDGEPGKDGADGKSAYQYAKEAGYTGTEAEFAEKLADNTPAVDSGAVNELIDTKLHSVTTYGAKGDGVTDDTAAFHTALAENRVIKVPGGTYLLSDTLVIMENCCLELSQDTILRFMQATGNCIEMRGSATLRGNHGNIDVSGSFNGNVISVDTALDGVVHASIPPYEKSTPMWKRQRFIYDVNITRTEGGFQGSLTGGHSGTALYISANYETTEEYDGSNTAPITYIWAMSVSGLRIAGAFDYGINIQNRDTTESGYGNSADPAWNHDMRIEAVIVGCETGLRVFNCNTAHLAVTVQPGCSINKVDGANVKYAKNGIILEHSKHIDLSQSIVWDWNSSNTLVDEDARNAHVALIGDCKGVILSDFLYNESTTDIRDLIYTDTPGNFDSLVIVQEPFTRWFKPVDGEPYFFDGNGNKRLAYKEEIDEYFQTDRVPGFINVLKTAIDTDGSIYNGTGTASGYYNSNFTTLTDGTAGAYHIHTGFIACKKGDTFITDGIGLRDDGCVRVAFFDSDFNYIFHANGGAMMVGSYQLTSVIMENGFKLTINPHNDANINNIAYARFNFNVLDLGENPVMSLNDEITFTQEGFLADGIKVKAENVVGAVGGGATPDWNAAEGEPGHILNRTHYEYLGKVVEEVTINAASFDTVITAAHPIVVGETYTVHWGEDTYICEAWDGSVINPAAAGMPGLGDYGAMMGVPVTGEPFLMTFTGNAGKVIGLGEDKEIPFSIDGSLAVKIPDKYLPDTMKYALLEITEEEFATASNSNDYTITLNRNISHYVSIFENGGTVLVKIPFDEGISISPVVCCVKLQGGFTQMFFVRAFDGIKVREYLIRIAVE